MKMSKNMVRVISVIMCVLMLAMVACPVLATEAPGKGGGTMPPGTENLTNIADDIINILKVVGAAIAVIVLLIMGIKYLMASVEEKADFKKAMIPYIVGALLVFAGPWIAQFVIDLVEGIGQ